MSYLIETKRKKIIDSYRRAFDYDLALKSAEVTDEEIAEIESDDLFKAQIELIQVKFREELIEGLRALADPNKTKNENVRLNALKELGQMFYTEQFKKGTSEGSKSTIEIVMPDNGRATIK